jgi:SWI/SNF-related matrix-associated actin-dependent regulator of chromatin subfamily A-like protein 1
VLDLLSYQLDGAAWLRPRRRAGLFDEPGVGKTAQLIRLADLSEARRIVVICPAIAREHWRGEFKKFGRQPRRVLKAATIHDYRSWERGRWDVILCSYEMAVKWAPLMMEAMEPLDLVVLDEAHYLKNSQARRTKTLLGPTADGVEGLVQWAKQAVWVTGTPIPNDPSDVWTFLRFCQVMPLSPVQFERRYFHSRQGAYSVRNDLRPEMAGELRDLIQNNSIRRRLADVGVDLPPIFLTNTLVEGDTTAIRDLLANHPGLDKRISDAIAAMPEEQFDLAAMIQRVDADSAAVLRRLIGEAKAIPYGQTLVHELHSGLDKMVVFGVHKRALHLLKDYLLSHNIQAVLINGDTPENHRQAYMRAFQEDADCRVLIGNIRAAGTALTLTASAHIDMLESDWSPAANWQALKRVHRLTQTRSVRARFITLAESFDEVVNGIVAEKTERIGMLEGQRMLAMAE